MSTHLREQWRRTAGVDDQIQYLVRVEFGRRRDSVETPEGPMSPSHLDIDAGERYVWVWASSDTEARLVACEMVAAGSDTASNPIGRTGDMPTKAEVIRALAGSNGGLPAGLHFTYDDLGGGSGRIIAWDRDNTSSHARQFGIGMISWNARGTITWVQTYDEPYQRRGVASAMLAEARKYRPDIKHSRDTNADSKAWIRSMASLSSIEVESPTPLDYGGKFWGPSKRFYLTDSEAGEPTRSDNYFHEHNGFKAPTDPATVAWLDIFEDGDWVYIAFVAVRNAYRGRGLSSRLIAHLYATYPHARIEWGTLIGDRTPAMYQRYKKSHPDQTGGGSTW